eukprot:31205-Pelagococcus_subviridis.AAC.23
MPVTRDRRRRGARRRTAARPPRWILLCRCRGDALWSGPSSPPLEGSAQVPVASPGRSRSRSSLVL